MVNYLESVEETCCPYSAEVPLGQRLDHKNVHLGFYESSYCQGDNGDRWSETPLRHLVHWSNSCPVESAATSLAIERSWTSNPTTTGQVHICGIDQVCHNGLDLLAVAIVCSYRLQRGYTKDIGYSKDIGYTEAIGYSEATPRL